MDEDWLDEELAKWVRDGIVTEQQAHELRVRYGLAEPEDRPSESATGERAERPPEQSRTDRAEQLPEQSRTDRAEQLPEQSRTDRAERPPESLTEDRDDTTGASDRTPLDGQEDADEQGDLEASKTRDRIVTALSVMGAALVGVGILVFLAAQWESLPRPVRLVILVGATAGFLGSGAELRHRRGRPLAGHALLGIGAVAIGVALFGIEDLYSVVDSGTILLGLWSVLALAVAHASRSKPIVLIGLVPGIFAVADGVPGRATLPVGLFALSIYGLALAVRESRWQPLESTYRLGSIAGTLGVLLLVLFSDVDLRSLEPEVTPVLGLFVAMAAVTVLATGYGVYRERIPVPAVVWTGSSFLVLGLTVVVSTGPSDAFPDFVRVLGWNAMVLGVILATVWLGYADRSPRLVNGAVAAFLVQLLAVFVSTVLEAVSASVALIAGGIVLLVVGAALERGRRELLARMRPPN